MPLRRVGSVIVPVQPEFLVLRESSKLEKRLMTSPLALRLAWSFKRCSRRKSLRRRRLTQEVLTVLRAEMGDVLVEAVVHDNTAVTESSGNAQSVFDYDRKSRGAQDYWAAAREIGKKTDST